MLTLIKKRIKYFFKPVLDENEIHFINLRQNKKSFSNSKNNILVEATADLIYVRIIEALINKFPNNNFIGVYTSKFILKKEDFLFFPFLYRYIVYKKEKEKFERLYTSIGVVKFYSTNSIGLLKKMKNLLKSYMFLKKLHSIEDLIKSEYQNIIVGDLIYDSFLRFENKPTFKSNRSFLNFIFYANRLINSFTLCEDLLVKFDFKKVFCIYASYVNHGSVVRCYLKNNIPVYTSGTEMKLFKLHTNGHLFESLDHENYNYTFSNLKNKDELRELANSKLNQRFNGKPDLDYMFKSSYSFNSDHLFDLYGQIDGVVFMHDFFDCVHLYNGMLFNDFYEWTEFLINLVLDNNLKIAFKPHPLEREESKDVSNFFKLKYPEIVWLDTEISNKTIFEAGIKFGTSVYGTVLSELAYHGIRSLSAGDNPTVSFDFCASPINKAEYEDLIKNPLKIKISDNYKSKVCEFYYMHYMSQKSDLNVFLPKDILVNRPINYTSKILNL